MGIFGFGRKKRDEAFLNNPMVQQRISTIEGYGSYDGSPSSKAAAQRVLDLQSSFIGRTNPLTETLYWDTLESTSLPMPLAAVYAFALGEYLGQTWYDPVASGGNTSNARMSAEALGIMFPAYKRFVASRHSVNETRWVLALSQNMLDQY